MESEGKPLGRLMSITPKPDAVFECGEGSYIFDEEGNRYLDFVQGWAVNALGHSPVVIAEALARQAAKLITPSPAFHNRPSHQLAERLVQASCFDEAFFLSSGAEANEGAFKLARRYGQKFKNGAYEIITFENSFHGRTLSAMAASGKEAFKPLFEPKTPGFLHARFGEMDDVKRLASEKTAAVMLEPVQGESGVVAAGSDFIRELRAFCDDEGILLIFDEIQTGIGRTGTLFNYEQHGIEPDIMTIGKGIGGGVPLAAMLAKQRCCCFEYGDQGGTYTGNPLMAAVGLAVVDAVAAPEFLQNVREIGEYLSARLNRLSKGKGHLGERGSGLLRALILNGENGADIVHKAMELRPLGLLLNSPRPNLLRFMPALTVTREEIDEMIGLLSAVV